MFTRILKAALEDLADTGLAAVRLPTRTELIGTVCLWLVLAAAAGKAAQPGHYTINVPDTISWVTR